MKRILFILGLLAWPSAHSQELINFQTPNKVTSVAYWSKGESRTFHVTRTKTEFKNNKEKPSRQETIEYDLHLQVIDSAEHSYTMEMTYLNHTFTGDDSPIKKSMAALMENKKIRYVTNEFGAYDSIINKREIADLMKKAVGQLKPKAMESAKSEKEKKVMEAALIRMEKMLTDVNNVEGLYSQSLLTIHSLYGIEMILNKAVELEIVFPAIDDIQMRGTGTLLLKEINKPKKDCKFEIVQKPNKEDVKELASHLLSLFFPLGDDEFDPEKFTYTSNLKIVYVMDLSNGWMNRITSTATTNTGYKKETLRRVEKIEFKFN